MTVARWTLQPPATPSWWFPAGAPVPKVGLHFDVPFEVYRTWAAWNHSKLHHLRRTPAHLRHHLETGDTPDTAEQRLGHLTHAAVLEPARFDAEAMVGPVVKTRRAKLWQQFEVAAAREGKMLLQPKERAAVLGMVRAAYEHETLGQILRGDGAREVCIVWVDVETGLLCKARVDLLGFLNARELALDLKTARDARERIFRSSAVEFGYFTQAAHILAGLRALRGADKPDPVYGVAVVEAEPPHCVAVYEVDDFALEWGAEQVATYLRTVRSCIDSGVWPGYAPGVGLLSLPPWLTKSHGE